MNLDEKENIIECVKCFKLFLNKPADNLEEIYDTLNSIPVFIANFIKTFEVFYNKSQLAKEQQFTIVAYLMQYCSFYELFKTIYFHHKLEKETMSEIKRCLGKQLTSLLDKAIEVLDTDGDTTTGSFLNLMDMALDKIAEIDTKKKQELLDLEIYTISSITEEILCLSMSVAQVAFDDDNKIITAGCRVVLNSIENLRTQCTHEEPNIAMCNLAVDTCTDTLCAFEARVNTAVLRLCLKVFSEYKKPLQDLYDFCEKSDKPADNDILDQLISKFDLHMDRVFQIGLFSIASSTMGKRVVDIQNVLGNLEFLEGELVPSFVALTKDSIPHTKVFANLLKKAWCFQVKHLRKAVHCVIEPSAYSKLIYEELKLKVEEIWQEISDGKNVKIAVVDQFLCYTQELGQMFKACIESFNSDMIDGVNKHLENIYKVLNELAAIKNLVIHENLNESHALSLRIFKRLQVLTLTIKRLWLSTMDTNQIPATNMEGKIEEMITTFIVPHAKEDDPILNSIMIKSKKRSKDRSICHFDQSGITFTETLKGNITKTLSEQNSKRYNKLRDCSYRQSTFTEGFANLSIANYVHPRIKTLRSEVK